MEPCEGGDERAERTSEQSESESAVAHTWAAGLAQTGLRTRGRERETDTGNVH